MPEQDNNPNDDNLKFDPDADTSADDDAVNHEDQQTEQEPEPELDPIEKLQLERDEFEHKWLLAQADYQNYVRRSLQNIETAREQKLMDVVKAIIPVLDHFDGALSHEPEDDSAKTLYDGVKIVRDELLQAIERFGVKPMLIDVGDPFDPNMHEALMRQKVEGIEPNHIAAVFQPGYILNDKAVRPAKVAVTE